MQLFKSTSKTIRQIDEFLNSIEQAILIYKEGVANYLKSDLKNFLANIDTVAKLEGRADTIRRWVENELYTRSLLPQYRSDVLRLMEKIDDVADTAKETLYQLDVEQPNIPKDYHDDFIKLAEMSISSAEALLTGARSFFRDVQNVKDSIHIVYFYEKEADRIANNLRRRIFNGNNNLSLSEKQHLRYFVNRVENLSNIAEAVADILAIYAIKRIV